MRQPKKLSRVAVSVGAAPCAPWKPSRAPAQCRSVSGQCTFSGAFCANRIEGHLLDQPRFEPLSRGDAPVAGKADDTRADAIMDEGWSVALEEGDYLRTTTHPYSGAVIHHVAGDFHCLLEGRLTGCPIPLLLEDAGDHGKQPGYEHGDQRTEEEASERQRDRQPTICLSLFGACVPVCFGDLHYLADDLANR